MGEKSRPLVVVGQGEWTYQFLKKRSELKGIQPELIWVRRESSSLPLGATPAILLGWQKEQELRRNLLGLSQRRGIHTLLSSPARLDSENNVLTLENGAELSFGDLVVEPDFVSAVPMEPRGPLASVLRFEQTAAFVRELEKFLFEVHRHAPKDLCVVLAGDGNVCLELAWSLRYRLQALCPQVRMVLLVPPGSPALSGDPGRLSQALGQFGLELRLESPPSQIRDHQMVLQSGERLEFDIYLPLHHWRDPSVFFRGLQADQNHFEVDQWGHLQGHEKIWLLGDFCTIENSNWMLQHFEKSRYLESLLTNLSHSEPPRSLMTEKKLEWMEHPLLRERLIPLRKSAEQRQNDWQAHWRQGETKSQDVPASDHVVREDQHLLKAINDHLPRVRAMGRGSQQSESGTGVVHVAGYDLSSTLEISVQKIFQLALLKAESEGLKPQHLHFLVSTPPSEKAVTQTFLPRTLTALDLLCEREGLELGGGQVGESPHWRLALTVVGLRQRQEPRRFQIGNHLILTRPLGFGALWMSRHHSQFNADWILEEEAYPLRPTQESLASLLTEFPTLSLSLVEDWGLLGHTLPGLAAGAQAVFNFREIPKWKGFETCVQWSADTEFDRLNWERVAPHLPFQREEVSGSNRLLWDPLSSGSLVIGAPEQQSRQVLSKLQQMGYTRARVVGCIRPQSRKARLVLSDWTP